MKVSVYPPRDNFGIYSRIFLCSLFCANKFATTPVNLAQGEQLQMNNRTLPWLILLLVCLSGHAYSDSNASKKKAEAVNLSLAVAPGKSVNRGEKLTFKAKITVFTNSKIDASLIIHDPDNHSRYLVATSKPIGQGPGEFVSDFAFTFPKDSPPGEYPVTSQVLLDGKLSTSKIIMMDIR